MTSLLRSGTVTLLALFGFALAHGCGATAGPGAPRADGGTPDSGLAAGGGAGGGGGGVGLGGGLGGGVGGGGVGGGGAGVGGGGGGAAAGTLDGCFAGLPARVGIQMVATKRSVDGRLRVRIALDTEGLVGTPGTMPWRLVRLGVEMDNAVSCITEPAQLTYVGSHHNCVDKASATSGRWSFELRGPDRATTLMTVREDGTVVQDSVELNDESCSSATPIGPETCRSGGPC